MAHFREGYNCSQSLVLTFADLLPLEESVLLKLSSSFGGGMGRLREVCGSVSGMFLVCGLLYGYDGPETGPVKAEHYARIQELARRFEEKHGSIVCRELLKNVPVTPGDTPEPRTPEFYARRPCLRLAGEAAGILDDMLAETRMDESGQHCETT